MIAFAALLALAGTPPGIDGYDLVNPRAIELFEREPQLMEWALATFDADGDGHLSIFEADESAHAFKRIADGDGNGQVTPSEYRAGCDFIAARWPANTARLTSR